MNNCDGCGDPPAHPGSVVRIVGRDHAGNVIELCSKCFISRQRDAAPPPMQLPLTKKKGKAKR